MAILLFVFFLIVFILMLVGSRILKKIKDTKRAVEEAADRKEQRYRNETGRQRQQYSQRPQPQQTRANARHTQTATGETIIDHHHETRESKKIFDDSDGEYVEFVEES